MIALTLGSFTFQEMEIPEVIPFHGGQMLATKKLIGGVRQIDALGGDPDPITWSGFFFPLPGDISSSENSALPRAQQVKAIMDAGQPVQLTWDTFCYLVYVAKFNPDYRFQRIPYTITLEVLQDLTVPATNSQQPTTDDVVGEDLISTNDLAGLIGDAQLLVMIASVVSAIYAASSVIALAQSVGVSNALNSGTSLVTSPRSVLNSILQAIEAAFARVATLQASTDFVLGGAMGASIMTAGALPANNIASLNSITAATQAQVNLIQVNSLLGRIWTNIEQINLSTTTLTVSGGNCYALAARLYGDPNGAILIMQANGLSDPTIAGNMTLTIPPYNLAAANGGIMVS